MNFRVLAASAQAPQRSNGNDFPPHNAPRPKSAEGVGGGVGDGWRGKGREGTLLKEDGGAAESSRVLFLSRFCAVYKKL